MKKYYFGILIICLFTVGMLIFTGAQGSAQKRDEQTHKKAQEIASDLNRFISSNRKIPENLEEAGIRGVSDSIKFKKISESEYEFCAIYSNGASYGGTDITSILYGAALTSYDDEYYDSESDYKPSTLYISYRYKKGDNCQKIKPILRSTRSSFNSFDDYESPIQINRIPSTSTTATSRNTERQTDIKAVHGQLEAYYAQNGRYPTLANLNSSAFRTANLRGLDAEALKDPVGKSTLLMGTPRANYYSYAVNDGSGSTCDNVSKDCAEYTLTATLEGGGTYVKQSLN